MPAQPPIAFDDKLDRIYRAIAGPLGLKAGDRTVRLEQDGFADAVVWNAGAADAAALADLGDGQYIRA